MGHTARRSGALAGYLLALAVRALSAGHIETSKSGHGRTVGMSEQLVRALLRLQIERKTETLKQGWPETPGLSTRGASGRSSPAC